LQPLTSFRVAGTWVPTKQLKIGIPRTFQNASVERHHGRASHPGLGDDHFFHEKPPSGAEGNPRTIHGYIHGGLQRFMEVYNGL
jgi:hypothetical protein